MPTKVYQNNSFSSGLLTQSLSTQSILDVFVVQGLISYDDAERLKRNFRTNRDIERVLLSNRIVTRDTINKAYSILLQLPYISLVNTRIDKEVLGIIPKKVAQRFGVIAFGLKDNNLQIAVSRPSELSLAFDQSLAQLMEKKPYKVDLYITGIIDYDEALKQYSGKPSPNKMATSGLPVVFLRNQKIAENVLKRLPLEFIEKHRAVIFFQKSDKNFAMAAERPDNSDVRKAIDYLQKENSISIQLFATSKEDIDFAIDEYLGMEAGEAQMAAKKDKKLETPKKRSDDEIKEEMESAREARESENKAEEKAEAEEKQPSAKKEGFSLAGIFSGINVKNQQDPALTIDSYEKVKQENVPKKSDKPKEEAALSDQPQEPDRETKTETEAEEISEKGDDVVQSSTLVEDDKKGEEKNPDPDAPAVTIVEKPDAGNARHQDIDKEEDIGALLGSDINSDEELRKVLSENFIPKVVAAIINYALKMRSSDIHIEGGAKDLRVRYRVDGILRDIAKLPLSMHPPMISRIKILSKMKIDETRIPQDGRFDVKFKNREVDVRVSALPTVHGEKIVMRVLDKDQGILSLEDLGMTGRAFDITIENIAKPYGIILSTGPTGSGKSTTLYAVLNRISSPSVNIITLEDPVEYEIAGVNQCQVKPAIGFTFAEGLRSVLRQDPNVVMVGEIRDGETASMATHAALTGHLVLSTLHTNDAAGALPRLINMGIEPFLITSSINEIIAQRLVRRVCAKCKEEMKVPQSLLDQIKRELDTIPESNKKDSARAKAEPRFYHGTGCPDCNQGYRGRVGIFEVLRMTEKIEELAIARKSANDICAAAIEDGMITMRQDGILKCMEGATTIDEIFRATSN